MLKIPKAKEIPAASCGHLLFSTIIDLKLKLGCKFVRIVAV